MRAALFRPTSRVSMSAFLTLDSISAQTPEHQVLFSDLTLSIGAERVGLVGRNGSGKSTLIRIIAGMAEPAAGAVQRMGAIAVLAQDWPEDLTLARALGVAEGMAVLQRVLSGEGSAGDFDAADWTLESRVDAALAEVGLAGTGLDRTIGSLSGGERTRVGVARLLVEASDLLLLDEPTNNLDAPGRAVIHSLIRNWRGGVLVASHDRELLETMDRIVEVNPVGVRIVGGGWSVFAALRDAERDRAADDLDRSSAALREAQRAVQRQREAKERRDKTGRAFAAKGSEPKIILGAKAERAEDSGGRARRLGERQVSEAIARAEEARARVEVLTPLTIALPPSGLPSGRACAGAGEGHRRCRRETARTMDFRTLRPRTNCCDWPERRRQDHAFEGFGRLARADQRHRAPCRESHRDARSACRAPSPRHQHPRQFPTAQSVVERARCLCGLCALCFPEP